MELRIIALYHITGSFSRNSYLYYNLFTKQLYTARAISTHSTAGLLQQINFLIIYGTPKLILKNTANSIIIIRNMPTLKQPPAYLRGSVRSIIIWQTIALLIMQLRCFYQTRSGGGFISDLITIKTKSISLLAILRIQLITAYKALWRSSGWRSTRISIVLLQLLHHLPQLALYKVRLLVA